MKSIKEKAQEVKTELLLNRASIPEIYEAGAIYVLECFESILPFVAKKGIIYGKIKDTIEQLKEK